MAGCARRMESRSRWDFIPGHWEVGLLVAEAARELKALRAIPFAGACTDPCDGRTQGTTGMMDSLPYRNDAAMVLRRLMRSLPTSKGVLGVATCDKGLPAMMMALASAGALPAVLVPGGVTLLPEAGEDAGKVQTIGARFAQQQITLEYAAEVGCRACAIAGRRMPVSGHGGDFAGGGRGAGAVAAAYGAGAFGAADLAGCGEALGAGARCACTSAGMGVRDVLTPAALRNAMVLHAAFGGSTNLLLHLPAIAFSAGLQRPTVEDWAGVNREVPRLVDALPNGPRGFATVQVFLAGGVPEVMLALRAAGLLDSSVKTVSGETLGACLDWWRAERAAARAAEAVEGTGRHRCGRRDHDAGSGAGARADIDGLFSDGESGAGGIGHQEHGDRSVADRCAGHVYRHRGPARVFITEEAAIKAIKSGRIGARRRDCADLRRAEGRGHAGDLPGDIGTEGSAALQACGGADGCAVQRRVDGRVHRAYFARGAGGRADRQGAAKAI